MKKALIVSGGWEGHHPIPVGDLFKSKLEMTGYAVDHQTDLDIYASADLQQFDLIVPNCTMSTLTDEQTKGLSAAVKSGVGLAGAHGGMGDSFRGNLEYMWMTGGQFLGHPHVGEYTVAKAPVSHELTRELPSTFPYNSEQYYMMVDPAVTVLLDANYEGANPSCRMPVAWTKNWGEGRVFYSALGHDPKEYETYPFVLEFLIRGMLWASR